MSIGYWAKKTIYRALKQTPAKRVLINAFHQLWYYSPKTFNANTFLGYPILQLPFDLWLYQEIIFRDPPPFILQTGVSGGGSVLYFAHVLDMVGASPDAIVVGVDIQLSEQAQSLTHPRIRLIEGDSAAPTTVRSVSDLLPAGGGMVILDSDHACRHVTSELAAYAPYVKVGHYLVVEDTNVNGHPVRPDFGPGPLEAVDAFLQANLQFARDDEVWQRNLFSFHQYGWLKRLR
jgi:cephalosporin hydroxylase